ncbi:hypothetical protein C8R47DRAFT_1141816 [Mycena vitilis]|nr:hypothetical protein C8R47DRAFT_1141816 [Mycena vitilis]
MAMSPRILAITWASVFFCDVVAIALYTVSLLRKSDSRWWTILMIVMMSIGAIAASFNSWFWWSNYKESRESASYKLTGTARGAPRRESIP